MTKAADKCTTPKFTQTARDRLILLSVDQEIDIPYTGSLTDVFEKTTKAKYLADLRSKADEVLNSDFVSSNGAGVIKRITKTVQDRVKTLKNYAKNVLDFVESVERPAAINSN